MNTLLTELDDILILRECGWKGILLNCSKIGGKNENTSRHDE